MSIDFGSLLYFSLAFIEAGNIFHRACRQWRWVQVCLACQQLPLSWLIHTSHTDPTYIKGAVSSVYLYPSTWLHHHYQHGWNAIIYFIKNIIVMIRIINISIVIIITLSWISNIHHFYNVIIMNVSKILPANWAHWIWPFTPLPSTLSVLWH